MKKTIRKDAFFKRHEWWRSSNRMLLVSGLSVLMLSGAIVSPPMANAGNSVIEQTKNSVNKKKLAEQ